MPTTVEITGYTFQELTPQANEYLFNKKGELL